MTIKYLSKLALFMLAVFLTVGNFAPAMANDPPLVTPNSFSTIVDDETLIDGITVSGDGEIPVQLRVQNGTLRITETNGLTMSSPTFGQLLEFSGTAEDINAALATLTYESAQAGEFDLEISLIGSGGVYFEETGSVYRFVEVPGGITWDDALVAAAQQTFDTGDGEIGGYLVIITSAEENNFVSERLENAAGWMGANDKAVEGEWRWIDTPESIHDPGSGLQFWSGAGNGSPVNGMYSNWNQGEPNNFGNNEDCGQFLAGGTGQWNDLPCSGMTLNGYVVEFNNGEGNLANGAIVSITSLARPDINVPAMNSIVDSLNLDFDINSTPEENSIKLDFIENGALVNTLDLDDLNIGNHLLEIDHTDITANAGILNATSNSLNEGIYDIVLRYIDAGTGVEISRILEDVAFDLFVPTITNLTPSNEGSTRRPDDFSLTFSEEVQNGEFGVFRIFRQSDDELIYEGEFGELEINGEGTNTLSFSTGAEFSSGETYYIQFSDGFFKDMRGRNVDAFDQVDSWIFIFRRRSSRTPVIDMGRVFTEVSPSSELAGAYCDNGQAFIEINFIYDNARHYLIDEFNEYTNSAWLNYENGGVNEVLVFEANSVPKSIYIKFQALNGVREMIEIDLDEVDCVEAELDIDDGEENIGSDNESRIIPEFSDYYGTLWAPRSELMGPSPWNGEMESINLVEPGWYIRGRNYDTVYLVTEDMKRRPFMDAQTFLTYGEWEDVVWVEDATLQTLPMLPMIVPKPEIVLVKVNSMRDVFFVEEGENLPILRRLASEEVAKELFGVDWADYVLDISPTMFRSYVVGEGIDRVEDLAGFDRGRMVRRESLAR